MVSAFNLVAYRKKKKNEPEKRRISSRDLTSLGLTVGLPYIAFFMLFLSSDDGIAGFKKWILFVEASTAGDSVVSPSGIAIVVTAMAGIALAATIVYSRRGSLKSPWSHRRRIHALQPKQWKSLFTEDGKLNDSGVKFLKKVRSGGFDPSIRAEVWPFLLGVYDINSSKEEREFVRRWKRKEFESLRKRCRQLLKLIEFENSCKAKETTGNNWNEDSEDLGQVVDSPGLEDVGSGRRSNSTDGGSPEVDDFDLPLCDQSRQTLQSSDSVLGGDTDKSAITCDDGSTGERESSDSDSSEELENTPLFASEITEETSIGEDENDNSTASRASVSEIEVQQLAESVGLKEHDHLQPCRIYHAARLVVILEAYTLFDPEIGYCQGMSDLLSPIISVVEDEFLAFWCFAGFMKKACHNFRLDEVGIRRQLNIVSKIIRCKDIHLYRHLEELQAEDCFVYRMVVVLFRRELNFEQTLCLWEVVWADQAAIRAGITKTGWGRMRLKPPPTDDLLLYAIAACILQRRKQIIEMYSSMDEIMRECISMAGQLDVWKLLDDDLVVILRDKI
ncbi:hypothetical protein V6N13_145906 [Hibiscus sabdariffa]|uniref:Rab-GAP TBC domain-containing protein n=1 Tax=Hibiscus sabdariffa TaxID=183260 RepID=A0ABR2TRA4_9ROSI